MVLKVKRCAPNFLDTFSGKRKIAIERYKRFMTEKESAEVEKFYGAKKQSPTLGDADFREQIKLKLILASLISPSKLHIK